MSHKNVQAFYEMISDCADLRDSLIALANQSKLMARSVKFGSKAGFEFTEEELADFLSDFPEDELAAGLSDEYLESISGGGSNRRKSRRSRGRGSW